MLEMFYYFHVVFFLKRAQIFVASVWSAFNGTGYGAFDDIHTLSMFADYRFVNCVTTSFEEV